MGNLGLQEVLPKLTGLPRLALNSSHEMPQERSAKQVDAGFAKAFNRALMVVTYLLASIFAMAASGSPGLGEAFSLRVGESVSIEGSGLGLRFAEVPRDSRCPTDANCIVAGEAHVVVEAVLESESVKILFKVPPAGSDTQAHGRFILTITALEPQTDSTRRIETSDYIAKMVVTAGEP